MSSSTAGRLSAVLRQETISGSGVSAPGSHDRSRRRYAVGDACGGHQSKYWHSIRIDPNRSDAHKVNGVLVTIGVLPPDFTECNSLLLHRRHLTSSGPDTQLNAFRIVGPRLAQATHWWLQVMGRLKPG
jgi:hypothetical protein